MTIRLSKTIRVLVAFGLVATLALLAGCARAAAPAADAGSSTTGEIGPMTIKVLEPAQGADVAAGTVKAVVETTGIKIVMPSNTLVAGEGHVHFTLDDRPFVMSVEPSAEFEDVEPGTHTLKAELVQNDTQPFSPPIEETIEFTVK